MVAQIFALVARLSPGVKRSGWQILYQYLAQLDRGADWGFMNYGFVNLDRHAAPLVLDPSDEDDRLCIQLYHRVAAAIDVRGLDVLEIGCGRGGGCSFIKRYLQPRSVMGVDLSSRAISLCRQHRARPGLTFFRGDAESLPLGNAAFDVVVNVESSHCYGSMPRFLSEVRRVLRPGGHFLFADLRPASEVERLRGYLRASALQVLDEERLTPGVLAALHRDSDRKRLLIRKRAPWPIRGQIQQFAGLNGSSVYEDFRLGRADYVRFVLRKSA
jgi:SAM-dependent methyltransferase